MRILFSVMPVLSALRDENLYIIRARASPFRRQYFSILGLILLMVVFFGIHPLLLGQDPVEVSESDRVGALLVQAVELMERGQFHDAVDKHLQEALLVAQQEGNVSGQVDALLMLADAYLRLGRNDSTVNALETALHLAESIPDLERVPLIDARLALSYDRAGRFDLRNEYLEQVQSLVGSVQSPDIRARVLNDLGTLYAAVGELDQASVTFEECLELTRQTGDLDLMAAALINRSKTLLEAGAVQNFSDTVLESARISRQLPVAHRKAWNLITVGELIREGQRRFGLAAGWRKRAYDAYIEALGLARQINDSYLVPYASGYIGRLYEDERRYDEALHSTRRAVFGAQQAMAPESLYLWEWQIGRLLREQGHSEEAIAAYRQAVGTLQGIRTDLTVGSKAPFRTLVGPVFMEFVDLMLQRAASLTDADAVGEELIAVRATLEQLKLAEVEEYFQDECVRVEDDPTELDRLATRAAVIYPVLLSDRTELLVSLPDGLVQFRSPVGLQELTNEVRRFRRDTETFQGGREDYLEHAQQLYRWLIAPIEPDLERQQIETLVMIPDGPLRTIPVGAMHDGESFLIEKYSVATTPGFTLTSPRPLVRTGINALATGITEAVQNFSSLPSVATELTNIESLYPSTVLKDENFLVERLESEISEGSYSVVHIATHAQFDSDHTKSFLLTYDGRLTMDRLQDSIGRRRYQAEPVELLVLSACQTAAGDDRAALGLAGVALKAGARSALATLWLINDESTALMVSEFYRHLQDPSNSKAQALQKAQLFLLQDDRFRHPYFWAPFLLISNWL